MLISLTHYYINSGTTLRAHTFAYQEELIKMRFNTFLVVGDMYHKDKIDASHFDVFHQMDGVHLVLEHEVNL